MSEIKTRVNDGNVEEFIQNALIDEEKRNDSYTLLKIYREITKEEAKMWGPSIIGFGQYHYKSERSRQEGDWPLGGFSPRKQSLTLYIMQGFQKLKPLLDKLGKHRTSVSCLYIKRLRDIDLEVLKEIIKRSYAEAKVVFLKS